MQVSGGICCWFYRAKHLKSFRNREKKPALQTLAKRVDDEGVNAKNSTTYNMLIIGLCKRIQCSAFKGLGRILFANYTLLFTVSVRIWTQNITICFYANSRSCHVWKTWIKCEVYLNIFTQKRKNVRHRFRFKQMIDICLDNQT